MVGCLAVSKAGHDKDQIYCIVKEDKSSVYVADGKYKTVSDPKRKNKKHIQIIKNKLPEPEAGELKRKLESGQAVRDEEVKFLLKKYRQMLFEQ